MRSKFRKVARRTLLAVTLLLGVVAGSFTLFNVVPGDPARIILGPTASEDSVRQLRHALGTDRPLWDQGKDYLWRIAHLDFGRSVIDRRSVKSEVISKFWITGTLGVLAALISLSLSYLLNLTAFHFPRVSFVLRLVNLGAVAPTFFTGVTAALLFGVWFPIVPLTGFGDTGAHWTTLLLPAFVASLYSVALMTRLLHEELVRASESDFARAAKAYGFPRWSIFHQTLLRPVAVTWLAAWVNQISVIFVASFILEVIFSIPGVGSLLISTIQRKDYPMLEGILLVNAVFFISLSWLSDTLFAWIDPRAEEYEG